MSFQFLKYQLTCGFFSSQATLHVKFFIVHVNWRAIYFWARFCLSNVKSLQKLCQKYTMMLASTLYLMATSHTSFKARDHCNLRALIGRKGGDHPSSLHIRRWRPKGQKKTLWMKSLHGVLHGGLWIRFHGLPKLVSSPPPKRGPDANPGRPWFF